MSHVEAFWVMHLLSVYSFFPAFESFGGDNVATLNYGQAVTSVVGLTSALEGGVDGDRRDPSFLATLTCSKLRIPSRPHRAIIVLSSSQGEPVSSVT